uniref:hypothetical protein n=1 Tax=Escherichia coli TaxID=562 RepID=UPI001BE442A9
MLPSEILIWQPEFTDKTLSRKPGAVQADISKIESRSFCERYAFVKGNELAVIEFWYNKSSQFTKVQPMPQLSNSTRLIDEIICQIGVLL